MLVRILYSMAVWIIVALVSYLVGKFLGGFDQHDINQAGLFLSDNAGLIGLLAGVCYFFFGHKRLSA